MVFEKRSGRFSLPGMWEQRSVYSAFLRAQLWVLLVGAFTFALLAIPAQVVELYRITHADASLLEPIRLLIALSVMGAALWFAARLVLSMAQRTVPELKGISPFPRLFPFLMAAMPFIGAAIGHHAAMPVALRPELAVAYERAGSPWIGDARELADTLGTRLPLWAVGLILVATSILAIGIARGNADDVRRWKRWTERAERARTLIAMLVLIVAIDFGFVLSPVVVPRLIGTFGLAALFVAVTSINAAVLTIQSHRWRVPIIPLLVVAAVVFSVLNLNDDHEIRSLGGAKIAGDHRLQAQFDAWLISRPDLRKYGNSYPVYIVSAQGGGIYAAFQAAVTLARIQDRCPAFKDHLFVISGVSGGSVGAAMFTSMLPASQTVANANPISRSLCGAMFAKSGPGALERRASAALLEDHLAPLVAGTFFPDFTQRFLPFAIHRFDRAMFLEASLEASSANVSGGSATLDDSLRGSWSARGSRPALLLNTTDAGSGLRYALSPLIVDGGATDTNRTLRSYPLYRKGADLRLSTAAVASARFPWVTPAATIDGDILGTTASIRVVDGGYIDNSGVETAMDLVDALEQRWSVRRMTQDRVPIPRPHFVLLAITTSELPTRTSMALGEMSEPFRALLSTRTSRAVIAIDRARQRMPYKPYEGLSGVLAGAMRISDLRPMSLSGNFYDLPLGWRISDRTARIISRQGGEASDCVSTSNFEQRAGMPQADCVVSIVASELNGRVPKAMLDEAVLKYSPKFKAVPARAASVPVEDVLSCVNMIRRQRMSGSQAEQARGLLNSWYAFTSDPNPKLMAFVLAVANYNSAHMTMTTEAGPPDYFRRVYGPTTRLGRALGNRSDEDAVHFVGRGYMQITGWSNYAKAGSAIGIDLLATPELVNNPEVSSRVLFWYLLEKNGPRVRSAVKRADWKSAWAVANKREAPGADGRVAPFLQCVDASRRNDILRRS